MSNWLRSGSMRVLAAIAPFAILVSSVAACSPASEGGNDFDSAAAEPQASPAAAPALDKRSAAAPAATPGSTPSLTLEGLGDLKIGEPLPPGSRWASRGAQISETCRTVSSPDFPGVYAIVTDGVVQRITIGRRSDLKLVEGIGVGDSEQTVRERFPGFREEPHKYVEAPAKYLTAPDAASGDPALRFETGQDGRISLIHVGRMPVLGYVEGCA